MKIIYSIAQKLKRNFSNIILNVAEKNDAAKSIAKLLSRGPIKREDSKSKYNKIFEFEHEINGKLSHMIMTSVSGHLTNYEFSKNLINWYEVDPAILFESEVRKVYKDCMLDVKESLKDIVKHCEMLIIWTDYDREGENIGMEIVDACLSVKHDLIVKRARFSEITSESVVRAINNLVDMNLKVSDAVNVRQELDLKTGAAFTRFQTITLQKRFPQLSNKLISYGSCQFPTLGFVVDRYREVQNFVKEQFWKITLAHDKNSITVKLSWDRVKLFNEQLVRAALKNITTDGSLACVISVVKNPKLKLRPCALDTIEMQKLASRKLKISPKRTMEIAEKLYSQGFISYPRTETNIFPLNLDLSVFVKNQISDNRWGDFARMLLLENLRPHNGKKFDNAHPPIFPLKADLNLKGDEAKIFELITRHFLSCLSKDAIGDETKIQVECISKRHGSNHWEKLNSNIPGISGLGEIFNLSGLNIREKNFLEIYHYEKWSDRIIPNFEVGEIFSPHSVKIEQGNTSPPSLLTDADLLTLMDQHGIGTDATHAEHIDKIKARQYVFNSGENMNYLVPGALGMGLVKAYEIMGNKLTSPDLRSKLEADLKQICQGQKQPQEVLSFYLNEYKTIFFEIINQIDKFEQEVKKCLDDGSFTNNLFDNECVSGINKQTNKSKNVTFSDEIHSCSSSNFSNFEYVKENVKNSVNSLSSMGNEEVVMKCKCNRNAILLTVKKNNVNKGRQFYTCSQNPRCGFFQWRDNADIHQINFRRSCQSDDVIVSTKEDNLD